MHKRLLFGFILTSIYCSAFAATTSVLLNSTSNPATHYGTVNFTDTKSGLLIEPKLKNLPAGLHGFHIHTKASCAKNGLAAGGHYDPNNTGKHLGPYAAGHSGDMPVLYVQQDGTADTPTLAPHLKVAQIKQHAVMIHQNGDNYADQPKKLGGGGPRYACGVIE